MGAYRARDLFLVPSLVSLARLPLAVAFVWVVNIPLAAMLVLLVAGFTDVFDGWYARRYGLVTATGTVVDPITDKLFMLTVVGTLLVTGRLSFVEVLLLGTRDLGEIPLVVWFATSRRARRAKKAQPSANLPGKLATTLQFATILTALRWPEDRTPLVYAAAVVGAFAAIAYWVRTMKQASAQRADAGSNRD